MLFRINGQFRYFFQIIDAKLVTNIYEPIIHVGHIQQKLPVAK